MSVYSHKLETFKIGKTFFIVQRSGADLYEFFDLMTGAKYQRVNAKGTILVHNDEVVHVNHTSIGVPLF